MNRKLPLEIIGLFKWVLFEVPKYLFILYTRFIRILNHVFSLSINLQLIGSPLFGDYTIIGRVIGFVYRVCSILLGALALVFVSFMGIFLPVVWFYIPIFLITKGTIYLLIYGFGMLLLYFLCRRNVPLKKRSDVSLDSLEQSIRPKAAKYYYHIIKEYSFSNEALDNKDINLLFRKIELTHKDFFEKITRVRVAPQEFKQNLFSLTAENCTYIEPEHIVTAFISSIPNIDTLLATYGQKLTLFNEASEWLVQIKEAGMRAHFWQPHYSFGSLGGIGKTMVGRVTPRLDSVSVDLTKMAQRGHYNNIAIHKEVIKEVAEILSGSETNVLLIGPPGCGKTTIVKDIASLIVKGTNEDVLKYKRIVSVDTSLLISGATSSGIIAQRINMALDEAEKSSDIVLFFDDLHFLVTASSSEDESSIFSLLAPRIANSDIQIIAATNVREYRTHIETNGSFARLFQKVEVNPASPEEMMIVLKDHSTVLEKKYKVMVTLPALHTLVKLAEKLIHDSVFPDKGLKILNRVVNSSSDKRVIDASVIKAEVSEVTNVPADELTSEDSKKLLEIDKLIMNRVIGQDHAVKEIANALQRARAGVRDENRPIASFLFVGTTGVGKTETAKALAAEYFKDELSMVRLDMSEYQKSDSINRLIGSPDGKNLGVLTEAVRLRPFSLVLLDEIEKADQKVLLTFLQVLDDGRLTDPMGTTVDFTNTIIIATSNVGTKEIQEVFSRGGDFEEMKNTALIKVRDHFAPEFLNRFSDIIVFKPLNRDSVQKIANIKLNKIRQIADEKNFTVSFKPELVDGLVNKGYDPQWGARELNRVIEDVLETYIAKKILSKEITPGSHVDLGVEVFDQQ